MKEKVIITCALTGGAPIKQTNPAAPYTTEEYVREAKRAEEAGAAILHIHFRQPDTGDPTSEPAIMQEVLDAITAETKLLINLSTGIIPIAPLSDRKRPIQYHAPDLASLNPGSMNFCIVNHRDGSIIYDWTYVNPFAATIEFGTLMKEKGIKPELECFDIGHIHNVHFFIKHYDFLVFPLHFSFVFGVAGGMAFSHDVLSACIHALPPGSTWQGIGIGPFSFPVAMASAIHGGHIRVGFEDSLFVDYTTKRLATSNGELVEKAVEIARLAGREAASPDEARQLLNLPSRNGA